MLIAQPTLTSHTTVCYVLHHNKLILELLFQKKKESWNETFYVAICSELSTVRRLIPVFTQLFNCAGVSL